MRVSEPVRCGVQSSDSDRHMDLTADAMPTSIAASTALDMDETMPQWPVYSAGYSGVVTSG